MQGMARWLACGLLLCATQAWAGQWTIGSATVVPNSSATIPVRFGGDGSTTDAEITIAFDESRLTLPVASGSIPGAAANGALCARVASNQVRVISPTGASPLANGPTVYCNIPFSVPSTAPTGLAPLNSLSAACAALSGTPSCLVSSGQVIVNGTSGGSGLVASKPEYQLSVLLSPDARAPTVDQLTSFDFASSAAAPLASLAAVRPIAIKALLQNRAKGDAKSFLAANPSLPQAKLERYIVVQFANAADVSRAKAAMARDPYILAVSTIQFVEFAAPPASPGTKLPVAPPPTGPKSAVNQYHLPALAVPQERTLAGGWGLLGFVDSGLETTHPELVAFSSGGTFVGGNFLAAMQHDVTVTGGTLSAAYADERKPVLATSADSACALPYTDSRCMTYTPGQTCMIPSFAGHGTHVASLAASNTTDSGSMEGVCRYCGIAMAKITTHFCAPSTGGPLVYVPPPTQTASAAGIDAVLDEGVQVINVSFGATSDPCLSNPNAVFCLAIQHAIDNQVIVVAADGNNRTDITYPASDPRVLAVGGMNMGLTAIWDASPTGNNSTCPTFNGVQDGSQCGSNYTVTPTARRQEVLTPAPSVRSAMYRGFDWSPEIGCGDSFDPPNFDGVGFCTGTSMSAPQITGLVGILRSINPLVVPGDPDSSVVNGIRNVIANSTDKALSGTPWDTKLGFGMPNFARAASAMLGRVLNDTAKNRVTPLFTLYSTDGLDFANVATPQAVKALLKKFYTYTTTVTPASNTTPGYSAFPGAVGEVMPVPRANAYVLTTEFDPVTGQPTLIPLYWLDRERPVPANCQDGTQGCIFHHLDNILVSTVSDLQAAMADGFRYRGRQGYIYPPCTPTPSCIPQGALPMYRKYNPGTDDSAIFLSDQAAAYQINGWANIYPSGGTGLLGYAYPNVDTDGDGLIDGMEYVIGTNPLLPDSDGDGFNDGMEYPQAGVPVSDPCYGPNVTCPRAPAVLFKDGFE